MSKVFGYPQFDENGEKILTTYTNEYSAMMMDIRYYRLARGQTRQFSREGEETAILLLKGEVTFGWKGQTAGANRKDVFTEGPWALHVCSGTQVTVTAQAPSEILVQCTKNEKEFPSKR